MKVLCPSDQSDLKKIYLTHIHVEQPDAPAYYCDHCGGIWLDDKAQAALFSNVLQAQEGSLGYRQCICGQRMMQVNMGQVKLDYCPKCKAFWFEQGKLPIVFQKIWALVQKQGGPKPDFTIDTQVKCLECGERFDLEEKFLDVGSGLICQRCLDKKPKLGERTWSDGEHRLYIEHQMQDQKYLRGQLSVEWPMHWTSKFKGRLLTMRFWQKLLRLFGQREWHFDRDYLDNIYWIDVDSDQLIAFVLKTHGMVDLLLEINFWTDHCEFIFDAHRLEIYFRGWKEHPLNKRFSPAAHVESMGRRFLNGFWEFHQKSMPLKTEAWQ